MTFLSRLTFAVRDEPSPRSVAEGPSILTEEEAGSVVLSYGQEVRLFLDCTSPLAVELRS